MNSHLWSPLHLCPQPFRFRRCRSRLRNPKTLNYSNRDNFDEIFDCRRRDVMRIEAQLRRQAKKEKNKEDDRSDRESINGDFQ